MITMLAVLASVFALLFSASASVLQTGEIAYKVWQTSSDGYRFYVTDGNVIIKAKSSKLLDDLVSCRIYANAKKGEKLMRSPGVNVLNIGETKIQMMKTKCGLFHARSRRSSSTDDVYSFNHDIVKNKPFKGDFETGAPSGAGSHFAIYPGTKWCGYENVAENMQDLGVHNETDACCRTHDHCPYYIDRFETKYHYFNHDPWTLSHCECDQHLYDCLKMWSVSPSSLESIVRVSRYCRICGARRK